MFNMIKKLLFTILIFSMFFDVKGQQLVEFSMGSSYQYDIYYSLSEGINVTDSAASAAYACQPVEPNTIDPTGTSSL